MLNQNIFNYINNIAGRYAWLDKLGVFFAVYTAYILPAILIYWWLTSRNRHTGRSIVVSLVAAVISRFAVVSLIRFLYYHPRPFEVMSVHQLIPESGTSFPSGHAAFFFALSIVIYAANRKLGTWFLVVSTLMGLARIYAGVHWPLDIVAGAIVGLIIGRLAVIYLKKKNPVRG